MWHVVCLLQWVMTNTHPNSHEPIGQETVPMTRTHELTLLDVIQAVSEVTQNDQEVIATVAHLISSGQVRLADETIEAMRSLMATMDAAA
jgi:hypothetical protein